MLLIEEGKDYEDVEETELPYTLLKNLGHGHSGTVEKVRDEMTKAVFARKIIYTPHSRLHKQERTKVFHNEVKTIRALGCHRHIVSVFATYITKRHFGLILQPVANDGDLEDFLGEYWSLVGDMEDKSVRNTRVEQMISIMERAFGCLAAGLAFMHQKRVRYKDIKPRNILIHDGVVLYTDFGYSFDSNAFSRSTTEGRPAFLTRKYSAPEVLEYEKRNSKSDVFSLGCVFVDLFLALTMIPGAEHEVKNYSESMDDLHELFKSSQVSSRYSPLPNIIRGMMIRDDSLRLCGLHLTSQVLALPDFSCLDCQLTPIEAWSEGYNRDFSVAGNDSFQEEQGRAMKKCCVYSAYDQAPMNSTNKENEAGNLKPAIQDLNLKQESRSKSLEPSGSLIKLHEQQAPAIQSVHISPPDHISRHWVYDQAASPLPSITTYPPPLTLPYQYVHQPNSATEAALLSNSSPQFDELGSMEVDDVSSPFWSTDPSWSSTVPLLSSAFDWPSFSTQDFRSMSPKISKKEALDQRNESFHSLTFKIVDDEVAAARSKSAEEERNKMKRNSVAKYGQNAKKLAKTERSRFRETNSKTRK